MINSLMASVMYCKILAILGKYLKRTGHFSRRRRKRVPEVFALIRTVSRAKA